MAKKKEKDKDLEEQMSDQSTAEALEEETEEVPLDSEDQETEADSEEQPEEKNTSQVMADLEEEKKACEEKMLRMAADLENFKKRMTRERSTALKYAEESLLKDLLPTIDNLERAIGQEKTTGDVNTFLEGVELTLKGLNSTVIKYGLTPLESVGQPFDPNFHEALVMEASSKIPAQSVIREFEKGYQYKDRLLRAAKVVVSKGEEE